MRGAFGCQSGIDNLQRELGAVLDQRDLGAGHP